MEVESFLKIDDRQFVVVGEDSLFNFRLESVKLLEDKLG